MVINTTTSTDEGAENKSLEFSALNTLLLPKLRYHCGRGCEKLLDVKAMYDYKEAMLPKHRGKIAHMNSK